MNKKKLIALFFAMILILTMLSGCASSGDLSGFLVPPQTTAKMKKLKNDIAALVGADVTFLPPAKGDYRNIINFCDIDSDGEDEAVAIYAPQSGDKVAHILILKHSLGKWAALLNFTISGTAVDILDFVDYDGNGTKEIVIGVSSSVAESKGLSIYDITGTEGKELLTLSYTNISITPNKDVLTVSLDKKAGNTAKLIKSEGKLPKVVGECVLYSQASAVSNIVFGNIETGPAFFISETLDGINTLTEIITLETGTLSNKTLSEGKTLFDTYLKRAGTPYIQDIDQDGKTEISRTVQVAAAQSNTAAKAGGEPLKLLEWVSFNGSGFQSELYTIINPNERYYFIIPNKWLGKVNARAEQNVSAITFYAEDKDEKPVNLFSIYAMTEEEWQNQNSKVGWSLLKKSNDRIYALLIYDPASELSSIYSITPTELDRQFIQTTFIQR